MPASHRVTVTTTEQLSASDRNAIIKVCVAATGEQDFQNLFSYVPSGGLHFLAFQDGTLASHAMVTTRWLQPEHHSLLRTAYVDAVATRPDCQGRGHASAVMHELRRTIDAEYQIACLQTDEAAGFYARLGWQLWRGPLAGRDGDALLPTPDEHGIMVLRLSRTPPLDLDSRLTIERQSGRIW
jgi:aminoglycoside 2'-N-acetyltransferase I